MTPLFDHDSVELSKDKDSVIVLDQTKLPGEEIYLSLKTPEEIYEAIYMLKVRGAPAIGIAAAFGLWVSVKDASQDIFEERFYEVKSYLYSSRPTAVNLGYALDRMERVYIKTSSMPVDEIKKLLLIEAERIKEEDVEMCFKISQNGLSLLKHNSSVLTHCNAGHLAVSRLGTALGPIYLAQQAGLSPRVYADETRPLLQGARLTAYELKSAGVDVTLICDNMAASLMNRGEIDMVFVGCDRVAANGDAANKIGTLNLAILAKHFGVPFYVLGPSSTIDKSCKCGKDIVIEERPDYEVTELWFEKRVAPKGVKVYNPAFDVTPAGLITGIITEKGIFSYPYKFE